MRILVTNDDGVDAPGIEALAGALAPHFDVLVVAPATNQTGASRSITLGAPVTVDEVEMPAGLTAFAVGGTPVDCVRFALLGIAGGPPELVVSGINAGANMGDDVMYSGTVAAALEGLLAGLPAIAVSQASGGDREYGPRARFEYADAAAVAARIVARVAADGLPTGTMLNVNAPAGGVRGVRACRLGRRRFNRAEVLPPDDEGGRHYRLYQSDFGFHDDPGTDVAALREGHVAVTPLHLDLTDHAALEKLASWDLDDLV